MRFSYYFLPLALIGLHGCVSVPNHDLAQLSSPLPLESAQQSALEQEDFDQGDWPLARWWELFGDPQLNELIELALEQNPSLSQAEAKVEFFRQLAFKQRSSLFPKLNLDYTEEWIYFSENGFVRSFYPTIPGISVPATTNQLDLTLNFSYEFDFWGKNRKRFQAALGEMRTKAAERAQTELILTTYLAQNYFQLQAHLEQNKILSEKLEQRLDLYGLTRSRLQSGIDSNFPLLGKFKDLCLLDQQLVAIEREISFDKNLIKMLTGQGPDSPDLELPPSAAFDEPFPLPENLSIDLLVRRPDLQAQIWKVESAAKEIGVAKADFYPNINLTAFAGLESLAFNDFFKWSSHTGALEPALHLPIFTGGKLRANLRSKVASYNEAVFGYNDLLLQAAKEVADQLIFLQTKNEELKLQIETVEAVYNQYHLSKLRFEKGINNYLNVLDVKDDLLNQELSLVNLRKDHLIAVLQLIKAFGGGYEAKKVPQKATQGDSHHDR